jgi:hypothetical protein
MIKRLPFLALSIALLSLCLTASAFAVPYDSPTASINAVGHSKVTMTVTAGASGALDGFTVCWMTLDDFDNYGDVWPSTLIYPGLGWSAFTGAPTLNDFAGGADYKLAPFESMTIEIGDLLDESGYSSNDAGELADGTAYVLCAFAKAGSGLTQSLYSQTLTGALTVQGTNCTYTQGYWKNHAGAWPVLSLTLGSVSYTQAQLLAILAQPVAGNGLISMAHQLIATKLNLAGGGVPTALVTSTIAAADAQIGALVVPPVGAGSLTPASTSTETQTFDDFNQGITGPGHCGETPTRSSTWGSVKTRYR